MQIGLLTSAGHPFAGFMIEEIYKKHEINCIILDKKEFSKKDHALWKERTNNKIPLIEIYKNNKIELIKVDNHCDEKVESIIRSRNLDLLVNCGTPRILNKNIILKPNIGILNCHPGILPFYRGCSCVEWALYNKDKIGNTCHLMSEKIDEGPIILIDILDINNLKSYQEIRTRLYLNSIDLINQSITLLKKYNKKNFKKKTGGKYYKPIDNEKMKTIFQIYGNDF